MIRRFTALGALLGALALVGAACAPAPPSDWRVSPQSITVNDGEDNDAGDEPYVIQIGFRSTLGVPGSSDVTVASQCTSGALPPNDAAPNGTTVTIPSGSADISFPGVQNLDLADLAMEGAPFEVIGTLSFVMERDGIFESCAVTDALRSALAGTLEDALELLIANSDTPPEAEDLVNLVLENLGDFVAAAGSLIAAVIEGLGNPDDIIGVAAQIHLPTRGALTDLFNTVLAIGGIFSPGLEQGFIPLDDLPSELQIRVGTLSPSSATFRFDTPVADYTYRSRVTR